MNLGLPQAGFRNDTHLTSFALDVEEFYERLYEGGHSDGPLFSCHSTKGAEKLCFNPRNSTLLKMFTLIDIGERAGSGIPNIFSVWNRLGWSEPEILESFEPDRIMLSLAIKKTSDKKQAKKASDKKHITKQQEKVLSYFQEHSTTKTSEIAKFLDLSDPRARDILNEMVSLGLVEAEGKNKGRIYKLKSE